MRNLTTLIAGFVFVALAIIAFFSDWNWQGALLFVAIGAGFLLFSFRGND